MKFALFDNKKIQATKGAKGICPSCGSELIAKCGEIKVNYWSHKGNHNCDPWWENETEWHRSWKDRFPIKWQEVVQFGENGEKHIADVKTDDNWVLEFQHSYLKPEERRARIAFYPKLVWVVDGLRRVRDISQFQKIIKDSATALPEIPAVRQVSFPEECLLLKEWLNCGTYVFFDFQDPNEMKHSPLWFLLPKTSSNGAYLIPYSLDEFIELHNNKGFDELANDLILQISNRLDSKDRRSNSIRGYDYLFHRTNKPRRNRL